ncbi:hypothetical protein ADUPG1_013403 [Aduncisulcus paluster]|uniref:Uncharacterized protein n=1 Tax=Aduncisulcus paluster TaxID=2918883 RepID=A0ABQ5K2S9_9EUKA|nr:hypothetical protein ADUPG1_013403 [Aduncisulcus paluster]
MATLAQYVKACRIAWKLYDLAVSVRAIFSAEESNTVRPWLLLKKPDVPLTSVTTLSLPPPLSTPSSSSMSSVPIPDPPVSMLSPRHIPDEFILKALFSLCQNIVPRPWLLLKKPDVPLTSVTTLSLPPPLPTPSSSSMSSVPIPDPPVSMLSPRHIPDEFILKALFSLCQNIVPSPPPQPSFFRRAANLSPVGQFMAKSCRKGVVTVSFLAEAARLASQHNINTPHLHHIPTRADLTAWENGKTQPRETSLSIRDDEKSYDISVMPITKNISFEYSSKNSLLEKINII